MTSQRRVGPHQDDVEPIVAGTPQGPLTVHGEPVEQAPAIRSWGEGWPVHAFGCGCAPSARARAMRPAAHAGCDC